MRVWALTKHSAKKEISNRPDQVVFKNLPKRFGIRILQVYKDPTRQLLVWADFCRNAQDVISFIQDVTHFHRLQNIEQNYIRSTRSIKIDVQNII